MPNRLDLPPELAALIEKRERDRRQQEADAQADSSAEEAKASTPSEERRSGEDRRRGDA